ncbi:MAG TPA: YcxB family protein, partial [Candidatus Limnocylindrales bacterium]
AGRWEKLATFWTAPGFATELMHLYLATDLRPATEDRARPEEDERLELERLPWREAVAAAERGEIADAKSLVGLDRLAKRMDGRPAVEPGAAGHVMARFRMSMRDAIGATAALTRASLATQLVGLGFVGLSVVGAVLGADPIPNLVTFLFGASLVTGWVCVPFVWYQARKRPELFRSESSFSADAAGVRYTSPFGNSASPWSAFKRVRSRSGYLFLDTGVGASLYVPLRAFDAVEQEKLDRLLRAAGVAVG